MSLPERMKFGVFMGPFHRVGENPTLAIDRDLELVQWLDYLGFDEAWIGEHHSAGWEIISSPEIFIAAAAERTRHIKLGTGVISLPYHHPLMVANWMVQLDHMTHGRVVRVARGVTPAAALSAAVHASRGGFGAVAGRRGAGREVWGRGADHHSAQGPVGEQ
jgi:limonene 1,2-monooxygenase